MYSELIALCRDQAKEARLKLAESHLKLGEVALETGMDFSIVFSQCLQWAYTRVMMGTLPPTQSS